MSLSDQMLAGGCVLHVEAVHGDTILILTGMDAGRTFVAVRENQSEMVISSDIGPDPRAKRIIRFRDANDVPRLSSQDRVQTPDGKIWNAVRRPEDGYLTTDFELIEVTPQDT